jgi:hypothetical protein
LRKKVDLYLNMPILKESLAPDYCHDGLKHEPAT